MTEVVPLNGVSRDEGGYFRTVESRTHCQGETGSQPMQRDRVAGDKGRSAHGAEEASEDGSETDRQGAGLQLVKSLTSCVYSFKHSQHETLC